MKPEGLPLQLIRGCTDSRTRYGDPVTAFTRIMALAMLAVWMSASAFCVQECASLQQDHFCCPKDAGDADDHSPAPVKAAGDCVLSSALTKFQDGQRGGCDLALLPVSFTLLGALPPQPPQQLFTPASPATSLSGQWQFLTRCASPPRAPSFVS